MLICKDDLVFGNNRQVIVLGGAKEFLYLNERDNPVQMYFLGTLLGVDPKKLQVQSNYGNLFGRFVMLIHDMHNHRLIITNDRFGMIPFYYYISSTIIVFSSHLCKFIEHGFTDKIDEVALSDMLAFNIPFGERTIYSGISVLSGGISLAIDLTSFSLRKQRTWEPADQLQCANIPLQTVQGQLVDLLLEGTEKATAGYSKVGVTLSGGIDSRLLLAAGIHLGRNMEAYTTGIPGSRSLAYAKLMAEMCDVAHFAYPLGAKFLSLYGDIVKSNINLTEGMTFNSEAEAHWLCDHIPADRVMMHGAFAELYKISHLHNYFFQQKLTNLDQISLAEAVWQRFTCRYGNRKIIFAEHLRNRLGDHARINLITAITTYPADLKVSGWLQHLYINEFLSKVTRYSGYIWNEHVPTHFPFSYPPFVDLLLRVRSTDKVGLRFPLYFLQQINTKLANFPDANTGTKIGASKILVELVHVRDWVSCRLFGSTLRYDHTDLASWLRYMEPPVTKRISDLLDDNNYNPQEIQKLGSSIYTNRSQQTADSLLLLLMFSMWMRGSKLHD